MHVIDGGVIDGSELSILSIDAIRATNPYTCGDRVDYLYGPYIDESKLKTVLSRTDGILSSINLESESANGFKDCVQNTRVEGQQSSVFETGKEAMHHQKNISAMTDVMSDLRKPVESINKNKGEIENVAHTYNTKLSLIKKEVMIRLLQKKCDQINADSENAAKSGGSKNRVDGPYEHTYDVVNGEGNYPAGGWEGKVFTTGLHKRKYHKIEWSSPDYDDEGNSYQTVTDTVSSYWWIEWDSFTRSLDFFDIRDVSKLEGWIQETGNDLPYTKSRVIYKEYGG